MRSIVVLIASSFLAFAVSACGDVADQTDAGDDGGADVDTTDGAADAGPDVDNGAPSDTYPAFTVDAPQVIDLGGPVVSTPNVVPVYFANDDTNFTGQITTFLGKLPASTYWPATVGEYNVGALTIATPIQLTENAPTSIADSAIQTWLADKIDNDPAFPVPDKNTIFLLYYPTGTSITLGNGGGTSCQSFGGYHDSFVHTAKDIAYAVIPRCGNFGGLKGLDAVSATTSHELIEASTDPYPTALPAYGQVDDNHITWMFVLGGAEVGDMCAQSPTSYFNPTDIGSIVQRTWSDKAAKAGHDPCQPADTTPYFNSMPVLPETLNVAGQITTKGVTIPLGQTKTIEVDLFSDAKTVGPWMVSATDSATLQGQAAELAFSWDRTTGLNGEKLHLSITVNKASQYNAEAFLIQSTLGAKTTFWIGLVGN
jgi:hypothetical protein